MTGALVSAALLLAFALASAQHDDRRSTGSESARWTFADDFENGLELWHFPHGQGYELVDTGETSRGHALALLTSGLQTHALIRGSEAWPDVRIEGELLFPDDVHNYLGFVYRYVAADRRIDFGSLYIKGNGSYAQANPHSDTNVGRTIYPERRALLTGNAAIRIGEWQQFALEVVGGEAHLYVGASTLPRLTVRSEEAARGGFGFKPRHPGGEVWIDNIKASPIDGFSYRGPPKPDVPYARDRFVTDWRVLGPLQSTSPEVESGRVSTSQTVDDGEREVAWRPFSADHRGAVITGRVTEYRGSRRVAYFHTVLGAPGGQGGDNRTAREAELEISTVDPLALWLNGEFLGFASAGAAAWWDAGENPDHAPDRVTVRLRPGPNELLVRAIGGGYATGGFYLRMP